MFLEVDIAEDKERIDSFLADAFPGLSRNQAAHLIEAGEVKVNDVTKTSKNLRLRAGDMVQIADAKLHDSTARSRLPENEQRNNFESGGAQEAQSGKTTQQSQGFPENPHATSAAYFYPLEPEDIPLDIRYEDDDLVVISKQANLVSHPSPGHETGTLANALVNRFGKENLGTLQGPDKLGLVHRLDMDTTGLMLVAKNNGTQQALQDAIKERAVDRRYLTLVQGNVVPETGLIDVGMKRSSRHRIKMMASDDPSARDAVTTFKTLERFSAGPKDEGFSLLECHLLTGRTHQIRLHMNHIHHPVVGDPLYGTGDKFKNAEAPRQFLHSYKLSFVHPKTGEKLSFEDPLPKDLQGVLDSLKDRVL